MKKIMSTAATMLPLLLASNSVTAETDLFGGKVKAGGYLAQQWQSAFEVDGNAALAEADSGFNRLRVGLWFNVSIADRLSAFIELAEEPNDFGGSDPFSISQDLAWVDYKLTDDVTLRIGNIVATTMNFIRYSDGAAVQGNPLVGNGSNDMITAEEGIWLLGAHDVGMGKLDWNFTFSKPSFFADFSKDSGYNFGLRSSLTTDSGFSIGAGYFKTTGDANCPTATTCTLSDGGAFNSLIGLGDGDNYEFNTTNPSTRLTHVGVIPAISADIWQIDVMYAAKNFPLTLHGFYGQAKDDYSYTPSAGQTVGAFGNNAGTFSQTEAELDFYGLFAQFKISDAVYLAARYTASSNETAGVTGGGDLDRIQAGIGYWLNDSTLIKAEYVRQDEEAGAGGGVCTQDINCDWDGFVIEGSVSF